MKKMTQFLLLAGLIIASQCFVYAQTGKIALQHLGSSTFYNNLTPALAAALNGDTIYLPGGPIPASGEIVIDKLLTIIGAGHYPDSTTATYSTVILSDIYIVTGADGGRLSGIRCNNLRFGQNASNQNVNYYLIDRCFIGKLYPSFTTGSTSQYILFRENVFAGMQSGSFSTPVLFEKNIFNALTSYKYAAQFENNIFYAASGWYSNSFNGNSSTYNNSIFKCATPNCWFAGVSNCVFLNSLFCTNAGVVTVNWFGNVNNNTITSESTDSTFFNATADEFSYSNNYHLKPTSNGHNAGSDGTDVGLYGTLVPYKEAAVPFNPHISSKNIGNSTNATGTLSVDILVSAQDR